MQRDFTPIHKPMVSFGFDPSVPLTQKPVSANFSLPSPASVAFSGKKRSTTVQPLKSAYSSGYVLHQDPAFRRDVQEFFGREWPTSESITKHYSQTDVPPVYKAAEDDLAVWRAGSKAGGGMKDGGKEGNMEDRVKSVESASRESLLERLRYKLFNGSP
ncbi:uncharacterized protein ALTATR162_LOCUS264 [Alternaria atra]|jgi:hypothetical protein|uniref:Uncharacterized protein n=1 Tax=Alternaria atra TaxID=119953 RepID=A0A8J2HTP4_9PLEO|nr:uncharacterized protein ALTATR162_LOCUS264 [Alternaria atra]CAG5137984.1 unnamed protein product [Alternaria atra]